MDTSIKHEQNIKIYLLNIKTGEQNNNNKTLAIVINHFSADVVKRDCLSLKFEHNVISFRDIRETKNLN